jgi:hypothetical protein
MNPICTACHSLGRCSRSDSRPPSRSLAPSLAPLLGIFLVILWCKAAMATITQGDFSFFGGLTSTTAGRWGEGSERGGIPSVTDGVPAPNTNVSVPGKAPTSTGGSFDFNHWDLVSARQGLGLSTDDHIVKSYKLLNRLDTLFIQDARVFADYLAFYDAFPDLKHKGRAEAGRDWGSFTASDRINEFTRNELKEYYGELNFTDSFAMRVGKQQVIWSEADAFSGTEVTNPTDFRFGNIVGASTSENSRVNLRMVKFDYILPDFLETANNEFEFFWIPGDFQGALKAQIADARSPWVPPVPINVTLYNHSGEPFREGTLMDQGAKPMFPFLFGGAQLFGDLHTIFSQNEMNNSIANSEFGTRYSTLIPVGSGLQASLIYLYEARSNKLSLCANCPAPPGTTTTVRPGIFFLLGQHDFGPPAIGNDLGTIRLLLRNEFVRQHWIGLTGTYYDKDLSDAVYRYDFFYAPKVAGGGASFGLPGSGGVFASAKWVQTTRWVVATDRPTYIPWISKQHTFLVAQYSATWNPDATAGARALSSFVFLAATNWLMDGRLTTLNVWAWDIDDNVGFVSSGNGYRYSRDILFGINAVWFLGRSGRSGGLGGILSRAQRTNELAFSIKYEL